jgi:hypothetical protein
VAAAGAPIVGTVQIKDSSNPIQTKTAVIAEEGSYTIDVSGLTPPFVLRAAGTVGSTNYTVYSFASGAGTANINPMANLAVTMASGGLDPATVYTSPSAGILQTIATKLPSTITDMQTKLQPLFALYNTTNVNPLTDGYTANHTGLDEVLDMVSVDVTTGTVTVKNKATNAVILTGPASNTGAWTVNANCIPVPQVHPVISPIFTTVAVNGTATFTADVLRSANKSVTWSVIESNGGTITSSGAYTAPAVGGEYHVKAVAAANPNFPAVAIVKVNSAVNVSVAPSSASVTANGSKAFTATVTGASNTQVTWSVVETNGGSITANGVYTAPATAGTYHVKAVSAADSTKSATATVTVTAASSPPPSVPFPIGTWVGPHGASFTVTKLFQATPGLNYYSGTVTFPAFGTVNITGSGPPTETSAIMLGADFGVKVNYVSNGSFTTFIFLATSVDNTTPQFLTQITGSLIVQSLAPGYNYNETVTFVKQ